MLPKFARCAGTKKDFPNWRLPEVAIVGRSNVGKSSLINHLFNYKGLAKTSSTPGKTQTVNFFNVNDTWALVDLPGYGYASRSKKRKSHWAQVIDDYLHDREQLKLILLLLDVRRDSLSELDKLFLDWVRANEIPFQLIFTKCDKLKPREVQQNIEKVCEGLPNIAYSIKSKECRDVCLCRLRDYGIRS